MNIRINDTVGLGRHILDTPHPDLIPVAFDKAQRDGAVGISVHSEVFIGYVTSKAEAAQCQRIHEAVLS